jgi:hypothetical protein
MSFSPIFVPSVTLIGVSDVISALKTISKRNVMISKTSITQGFETNAGAGPFSEGFDSTYATSTSVAGTLTYPQAALTLQSRWTTLLVLNEGKTPGTTVVSVNGGAYSATDETLLYNKTTGLGTTFKVLQFQVPIGFSNLTSVNITFNKASSTADTNAQMVYVLPGQWSGVSNAFYGGGASTSSATHSTTSLSVLQNDLVFVKGAINITDSTIPTISHSGPAHTRILETNSTYGGNSRQISLQSIDAAGTFVTDTGYTATSSGGGGGHTGAGSTTTYHFYSNFVQSMRFVTA